MAGLGECDVGTQHPEDEKVTEVRLRYAGFREGDRIDPCLTYTTIYFSLYERPGTLIQNRFRSPKSIVECGRENAVDLISRCLFVGGGVTYPPRDEVLMSLQVPTGHWTRTAT